MCRRRTSTTSARIGRKAKLERGGSREGGSDRALEGAGFALASFRITLARAHSALAGAGRALVRAHSALARAGSRGSGIALAGADRALVRGHRALAGDRSALARAGCALAVPVSPSRGPIVPS